MNRKGFTLIELLAVIVILSGISLIVIGSVSTSLINRDKKECEEQKELAKNAAKLYFSLDKTGDQEVTVGELKTKGLLDSKKSKMLNEAWKIKITSEGYTFTVDENSLQCLSS